MAEPTASRPYMPGYGLLDADRGTGLLSWAWAVERLTRSHDYWVATIRPDGHPHLMPVWGVWMGEALWFSSSRGSRKTRNLAHNAHCAISTDNANEPVVIEGEAKLIGDLAGIGGFVAELNGKYKTEYSIDFFNPRDNACFQVRPSWAFALAEADFTGTPTRWTFPPASDSCQESR